MVQNIWNGNMNQPSASDSLPSVPQITDNTSEYQTTLLLLLSNYNDFSKEDLANNLKMVLNNNMDLKETLVQNNVAIGHQLALMEKWSRQSQHEKERNEAVIANLQMQLKYNENENQVLKKTISSCQSGSGSSKFKELDATIQCLTQELEISKENLKKANGEKYSFLDLRLKVEEENTLLKHTLSAARKELDKIKQERQEFVQSVNKLKQNAEKGAANFPVESHLANEANGSSNNEDISKYKEEINRLGSDLRCSKEETERYKALYGEASVYQDAGSLVTAPSTSEDNERRILKNEVALLKDKIVDLEKVLRNERDKASVSNEINLMSEITRLKNQLQETKEIADRGLSKDQYYQAMLKSKGEQYDEATARLVSYEELLGTKNDEIHRLKKELGTTKGQLTEIRREDDIVSVLRAQVEVYQADFRAEREAREGLAADREKLREEVKHLNHRNMQLVDELEAYHRRTLNVQREGSRAASEEPKGAEGEFSWEKISIIDKKDEPPKQEEIDENVLYCPKCNKTFTEIGPLEQHVNRCLDED